MKAPFALCILFLTGCHAPEKDCYCSSLLANVTDFKVKVDRHTPSGIGCRIDRVPDYGSRDSHRVSFDGCLSGVSSSDGSLYLILILVAVVFYLLGKSRGAK